MCVLLVHDDCERIEHRYKRARASYTFEVSRVETRQPQTKLLCSRVWACKCGRAATYNMNGRTHTQTDTCNERVGERARATKVKPKMKFIHIIEYVFLLSLVLLVLRQLLLLLLHFKHRHFIIYIGRSCCVRHS